jgi:acetyl-CoA acetyltransferase
LEKIKNSPIVASPFRLMDCSLSVNGGAAVILSQEESDIKVIGSGFATELFNDFWAPGLNSFQGYAISC